MACVCVCVGGGFQSLGNKVLFKFDVRLLKERQFIFFISIFKMRQKIEKSGMNE